MPTAEEVRSYCERFSLTFVQAPAPPLDDGEEWPDSACAGFDGDPSYGACVIHLGNNGCCWVVTAFADGIRRMTDRRELQHSASLNQAVSMGSPLHPTE
jgi:hypothetical protein